MSCKGKGTVLRTYVNVFKNKLVMLGVCVPMLAVAFVAALPNVAHAGNITNSAFSLSVSAGSPVGGTDHTYLRDKLDNTPSYAIATGYSSGALVGIAGIDTSFSYTNRTKNTYAYFRALNQHSTIRNWV